MSAIRLARAYTGRDTILKFEGCYHGHADSLLVKAGSGAATLGIPDSPGVPADVARHTLTASYNDVNGLERTLEGNRGRLACVIVEPVAGNMGVIPPHADFLERLRDLTRHYGIVLIFDEVITGFRVAYGGAQGRYGVTPDLTCLGKIIGGGLPVGAYGGSYDLMKLIAPDGPVYQAGTLSGNPLAVTAGIETLKLLRKPGLYRQLEERGRLLSDGLTAAAREMGVALTINRVGSMLTTFFTPGPVIDYASAKKSDTLAYGRFFREMLEQGIYLAPSQFEAAFLSTAHNTNDIAKTVKAARAAFKKLSPSSR
jgi:glutamate-1-semialdehyde 2,1-aminomutase